MIEWIHDPPYQPAPPPRRPPAETVKPGFRPDIQGLRAVAVGLVILAHLVTYGTVASDSGLRRLSGGFIGVDVFFVISGFLITRLMVREAYGTGRIALLQFYARRARRILPAATVVLVVVLCYSAVQLSVAQFEQFRSDAWWSALFLANWHFAHQGTSYFDTSSLSPFRHFWSLAVEEQFYLAWPLVLTVIAPRVRRRVLVAVVGTVALASFAWSLHVTVYGDAVSRATGYYSTPARCYELAIGAVLAVVPMPRLKAPVPLLLGLAGMTTLAVATLSFGADSPFPGWQALVPTLAAAALIVAGNGQPTAVTRLLSMRPMRYVGDLSYSLYLWHFPVVVLGPSYLPHEWRVRTQVLVSAAIMLVLAVASYHLIERPFLRRPGPQLARGRRGLVLWPAALALLLVGVTFSTTYAQHSVKERNEASESWWAAHAGDQARLESQTKPHPSASATARAEPVVPVHEEVKTAVALTREGAPIPSGIDPDDVAADDWENTYTCFAGQGATTTKICPLGDSGSERVVAVVGDSHAGMWLPALDQLGKEQHLRIVPLVKLGCAPYDVTQWSPNREMGECAQFRAWSLQQLQHLHPETVVLAARGALYMKATSEQTVAEQWRAGVHSAVKKLLPLTDRVIALADVPARHRLPADCLSDPDSTERSCMMHPGGREWASNVTTRDVVTALGADFVDTRALVCAGRACPLFVGERVLYHDTTHLTQSWVRYVAGSLGVLTGPLVGSATD